MLALEIENLVKTYRNQVHALKGISLNVQQGDFFGLLGPNGAGKSTTISIICSLVRKTSGTVRIFGQDIDENFAKAKSHLGIVPQEFNFSIFETPEQIVAHQAGYFGIPRKEAKERAHECLRQVGLWEKRAHEARSLSGGMKRRLMIARAIVHGPELLILDEPTAGVDIEIRRQMWEFLLEINAKGTTIILTTHYLEEAEHLCKNIAIIDHGDIIEQGDVRKLLSTLQTQSFILDLAQPAPMDIKLPGFPLKYINEHTLETELRANQTLNELFAVLNQQHLSVSSMRNKVNRLEELFVRITHNTNGDK